MKNVINFITAMGLNNMETAAMFSFLYREGDEGFISAEFTTLPDGSLVQDVLFDNEDTTCVTIDRNGNVHYHNDGCDTMVVGNIYQTAANGYYYESNNYQQFCYVLPDIGKYNQIYLDNAGINLKIENVAFYGNNVVRYEYDETVFEVNLIYGTSRHKSIEEGCFWTEWQ